MPQSTPADVRRLSLLLQSVRIRQAARSLLDVTRLGHGTLERLCSALILGAAFFLPTLLVFWISGVWPAVAISIAVGALLVVEATCAALVLWASDTELEKERGRLEEELPALRDEAEEYERKRLGRLADEYDEREARRPTTKLCPYCSETVPISATKCKHCGELLSSWLRESRQRKEKAGVAAVLSFLIPGLGQIYQGQIVAGLCWNLAVLLGYMCGCLVIGFILHVICIFDAAS